MEAARKRTPKAKPANKKIWILLGAGAAIALVAAGLIISQVMRQQEAERQAIIQSSTFHEGVSVNGVAIGGMTKAEAMEALRPVEESIRSAANLTLSFEGESQSFSFPVTPAAFGFTFDTSAVLDEALTLARDGTLKELEAELADIAATGRSYEISYAVSEDTVRAFTKEIAGEVNTPPTDAVFTPLVQPAPKPGTEPEPSPEPEEEEKKEEAESDEAGQPAEGEEPPPQTAASMGFVAYEPDSVGYTVDEEALTAMLLAMAESGSYGDADIPMHEETAALTLETLQAQLTSRSSAVTSFAKSPYYRESRVFNMRKAASLINGTVLQPDQEFSTNGALGDRTYELGWQGAPAIVRGRNEDQAGGGVCQVSTTLYHAVLKADLQIVYRQGHSGRLGYVAGGLDATIDSGRIDFKFKNNTASPIYIFAWLDEENRDMHVEIYGEPLPYDEIQLSSEQIKKLDPPGEMQYQYDYSLAPGKQVVYVERKSGSVWQSYATYIKDGVEVEKKEIAKTTYDAYAGLTYIGPPVNEVYVPEVGMP